MTDSEGVPLTYIPSRLRRALEHYKAEFDDMGMAVAKAQLAYLLLASAHNDVVDELATYVLEVEGLRDVIKAYEEERQIMACDAAGCTTEGTERSAQVDLYFGDAASTQPGGPMGTGDAAPLHQEGSDSCGEGCTRYTT